MNNAAEAILELGIIDAVCQTSGPTSNLLHIGSCLGWTQPGGDQVCPIDDPSTPTGFRFGTIPGTSSKCNCEGFDVPIQVLKSAQLEIVKACVPSTDGGSFDLLIDGSNQFADDVACGGTTGSQTVGAGTSDTPGAIHTFGEAAGTNTSLSSYTSSFACVNRGTNTAHAPASGTSTGPVNITLERDEDVICTYTNVRQPQVKLVKSLVPTNDVGRFDLTIGATTFNNGGAGFGHTAPPGSSRSPLERSTSARRPTPERTRTSTPRRSPA